MTDQILTPDIEAQLKPDGVAFRPDLTVREMFFKGNVTHKLIEPSDDLEALPVKEDGPEGQVEANLPESNGKIKES